MAEEVLNRVETINALNVIDGEINLYDNNVADFIINSYGNSINPYFAVDRKGILYIVKVKKLDYNGFGKVSLIGDSYSIWKIGDNSLTFNIEYLKDNNIKCYDIFDWWNEDLIYNYFDNRYFNIDEDVWTYVDDFYKKTEKSFCCKGDTIFDSVYNRFLNHPATDLDKKAKEHRDFCLSQLKYVMNQNDYTIDMIAEFINRRPIKRYVRINQWWNIRGGFLKKEYILQVNKIESKNTCVKIITNKGIVHDLLKDKYSLLGFDKQGAFIGKDTTYEILSENEFKSLYDSYYSKVDMSGLKNEVIGECYIDKDGVFQYKLDKDEGNDNE